MALVFKILKYKSFKINSIYITNIEKFNYQHYYNQHIKYFAQYFIIMLSSYFIFDESFQFFFIL